jgi:hypothetical protein
MSCDEKSGVRQFRVGVDTFSDEGAGAHFFEIAARHARMSSSSKRCGGTTTRLSNAPTDIRVQKIIDSRTVPFDVPPLRDAAAATILARQIEPSQDFWHLW